MIEYIFFFVGILFLGDVVLVPLVYFAVTHSLPLLPVLGLGFIANTITDIVWYYIGANFPKENIFKTLRLTTIEQKNPELFLSFKAKANKILFLSKFLYGLRVPVRILYGLEYLPFKDYLKVNIAGSCIWLVLISGLAFTLDVSIEELRFILWRGEIAMGVFFILVIMFEMFLKKHIKDLLDL